MSLPKPYYDEDGITIYNSDCRDILPYLPKVDLVLTDPPYGIHEKFSPLVLPKGDTRTLSWHWDTPATLDTLRAALDLAIGLNPPNAFVFCGLDSCDIPRDCMRSAGYSVRQWAWVKQCPPPPAPGNRWVSAFELGVFGFKPGAYFADTNPMRTNVVIADAIRHGNGEKNGHPTQKPLEVMKPLLQSLCPVGGLLLDPFMGSGTTLVAAKQLGRKAIGIEIEEKYCEIAVQRLAQKVMRFD